MDEGLQHIGATYDIVTDAFTNVYTHDPPAHHPPASHQCASHQCAHLPTTNSPICQLGVMTLSPWKSCFGLLSGIHAPRGPPLKVILGYRHISAQTNFLAAWSRGRSFRRRSSGRKVESPSDFLFFCQCFGALPKSGKAMPKLKSPCDNCQRCPANHPSHRQKGPCCRARPHPPCNSPHPTPTTTELWRWWLPRLSRPRTVGKKILQLKCTDYIHIITQSRIIVVFSVFRNWILPRIQQVNAPRWN